MFSESTFALSSAFLYTTRSSSDLTFKQYGRYSFRADHPRFGQNLDRHGVSVLPTI